MKTAAMKNPSASRPPLLREETNSISRLLLIGGAALLVPLTLYVLSMMAGAHRSAWETSWQGFTLYLPFAAALLTLVVGARHLSRQHYTRASRCLGLAVVQGVAALALTALIGWATS